MEQDAEAAVKVLEDAKRRLFEEGWTKGWYVSTKGRCLVGALYGMQPGCDLADTMPTITWPQVSARIALQRVTEFPVLTAWNDEPDRTFGEVIDAIDQAIVHVKEGSR